MWHPPTLVIISSMKKEFNKLCAGIQSSAFVGKSNFLKDDLKKYFDIEQFLNLLT